MIYSDLGSILVWWLMLFVIGISFLPLTLLIFQNFFDKGYIFSKILGLMIVTYIIWFLGSIRILPFSLIGVIGILIVSFLINTTLAINKQLFPIIKKNLVFFLFEETLFLIGLIFWCFVRSSEPSIHGLEKFMDFGFMNSILRSEFFPPKDLWLTPETINYYYFGHLAGALLTKLSGINPDITFNLILSTIFGLTLVGSFSLGLNLYIGHGKVKSSLIFISGLLSSFLVTFAGNLHTIYAFFKTYTPADNPVPFWVLQPMFNFTGYWYPNATRFIPFTIHEFPLYSFVVADLHGHVLDIPFVLLMIALLLKIFFEKNISFLNYILLALNLSVLLMSNVLDAPIYLLFTLLILFFKFRRSEHFKQAFLKTIKFSGLTFILLGVFSLPFWLSFKPFASGIGVLCAPKFLTDLMKVGPFLFEADHCSRSPLWMLAILYGFFYTVFSGFVWVILKNIKKNISSSSSDYLVFVLVLFSTILILIPEFFYAKDIYPQHYRANTVFKFGYQAFIILSLSSGYMLVKLFQNSLKHLSNFIILSVIILMLVLISIYPYFAINSYYGSLKESKGLNGLKYFQNLYPDDYLAISWLRQMVKGQPVILEAQGDSYTDFARVSSNTGLPTVIGWPVHEWLWRGSYTEAGKRVEEVTKMYEGSLDEVIPLLKKYNVSYIFLGTLEKQKYTKLNEDNFIKLGTVVFETGNTKIYKIK